MISCEEWVDLDVSCCQNCQECCPNKGDYCMCGDVECLCFSARLQERKTPILWVYGMTEKDFI